MSIRSDFYALVPVDLIAARHDTTETEVFAHIGQSALVKTRDSLYRLHFGSQPTATRVTDTGDALRRDTEPVPLVTILQWKPNLILVLDIRGDGINTVRTTSPVERVVFS